MGVSSYLIRKLLPGFRSGHTQYVDCVKQFFRNGCRWLDAGGGRRVFHDLYDGEQDLVARAGQVVACDADAASLKDHVSISNRICCSLDSVPLPSNSFDYITCGMVLEHLADPQHCIMELARLLDANGSLIIHTVNYYGHPTLIAELSRLIPFRRKLISIATGRKEEDIFPTYYRCNTASTMRRHLQQAGLQIIELRHMHAGLLFGRFWPIAMFECLYMRINQLPFLSQLRGQLLVIAKKSQVT